MSINLLTCTVGLFRDLFGLFYKYEDIFWVIALKVTIFKHTYLPMYIMTKWSKCSFKAHMKLSKKSQNLYYYMYVSVLFLKSSSSQTLFIQLVGFISNGVLNRLVDNSRIFHGLAYFFIKSWDCCCLVIFKQTQT